MAFYLIIYYSKWLFDAKKYFFFWVYIKYSVTKPKKEREREKWMSEKSIQIFFSVLEKKPKLKRKTQNEQKKVSYLFLSLSFYSKDWWTFPGSMDKNAYKTHTHAKQVRDQQQSGWLRPSKKKLLVVENDVKTKKKTNILLKGFSIQWLKTTKRKKKKLAKANTQIACKI